MEEKNPKKEYNLILSSMESALANYSTNAKNLERIIQYVKEAPRKTELAQELMKLENNYISRPEILENILNGIGWEKLLSHLYNSDDELNSEGLLHTLHSINTELFKKVAKQVNSLKTVDFMARVARFETEGYGDIQKQNESLVNEVCKTTESYIGSDFEEEIPAIGWKTLLAGPYERKRYRKGDERKSAIEAMKTLRNPDIVKVLKGIDIDKDDFFLSMLRQMIAYHGEAGEIGKTIEQMVKLYTNFSKINREPFFKKDLLTEFEPRNSLNSLLDYYLREDAPLEYYEALNQKEVIDFVDKIVNYKGKYQRFKNSIIVNLSRIAINLRDRKQFKEFIEYLELTSKRKGTEKVFQISEYVEYFLRKGKPWEKILEEIKSGRD